MIPSARTVKRWISSPMCTQIREHAHRAEHLLPNERADVSGAIFRQMVIVDLFKRFAAQDERRLIGIMAPLHDQSRQSHASPDPPPVHSSAPPP